MSVVSPITKGEFLRFLQKCRPPGGWPRSVAVANSAGPDSICLLYLLSLVVKETAKEITPLARLPESVTSVHVHHSLQAANETMAATARRTAAQLGVGHHETHIHWGRAPFPPRPTKNEPIEEIARHARSNRLFNAMSDLGISCMAFAHHADDQVETSIMRLTMGSGIRGAAGMRPIRRWGMGGDHPGELHFVGAPGMNRWIVRPLLDVPKSRILATCTAGGLEWVTDKTNFQPDLTFRNFIRHTLNEQEESRALPTGGLYSARTPGIKQAIEKLTGPSSTCHTLAHLREKVRNIGHQIATIDTRVDKVLANCTRPSPPSTLLLSATELHSVMDPEIRTALVRRTLRYVSPKPWGSITAESMGKHASFDIIQSHLWPTLPTSALGAFSAGSDVLWKPVAIRRDGQFRERIPREGESLAWLVQRQPPWNKRRRYTQSENDPLVVDLTKELLDDRKPENGVEVLYDCRFRVIVRRNELPQEVLESLHDTMARGSVMVESDTKYFLPMVVWRRSDHKDVVLAKYPWTEWRFDGSLDRDKMANLDTPWIHISCIRSLDAI